MRVGVTSYGRRVVVEVDDRGVGDGTMHRVLDLGRQAYAYPAGVPMNWLTDQNPSMLQLTATHFMPAGTTLGPVER